MVEKKQGSPVSGYICIVETDWNGTPACFESRLTQSHFADFLYLNFPDFIAHIFGGFWRTHTRISSLFAPFQLIKCIQTCNRKYSVAGSGICIIAGKMGLKAVPTCCSIGMSCFSKHSCILTGRLSNTYKITNQSN